VDENNSPYLDVQKNSLEVNTPHSKQINNYYVDIGISHSGPDVGHLL
jgi:hypothetical protein